MPGLGSEEKSNISSDLELSIFNPQLAGINFIFNEYDKVTYPKESIIYCDPPYESTTKTTKKNRS